MRRLAAATVAGMVLTAAPVIAAAAHPGPASQVRVAASASTGAWTVYHHDDAHTGYDGTQPSASTAAAGWVSTALDGSIYAEPLVYNGTVYAVTLHGTVYAINQSTGATAWSINVGTPQSVLSGQCGNINPLGISGTPAIDAAAGRIYVSEILPADNLWHVFGIDLTTHLVVMNTPIPANLGTGFDWTIEQERGALGLANGYVYVPFGGRIGDCGAYHGWIFAVPTNGGAVTSYYETPGQGAGFWTAGGIVVDDSTGKVFDTTGNGTASGCNQSSPGGPPVYENDAVVRLSATLAHEDSFIPADWYGTWCINDQDLGSASMVLISPTLAFQAGKAGNGFLVNPQALGVLGGQVYPTPKPMAYAPVDVCRGDHSDANFGSYAYAAPYVYLSCEGNGLVALKVDTTAKSFSSCAVSCSSPSWNAGGFSPGPPIVAGGAVWAVDTGGGGLYGFDAATGAQIYHSAGFGVTHFTSPSEAGGQIFVGSGNVVRSFNLVTGCSPVTLTAAPPATSPSGTPVSFTASAANCVNPSYEFWMLPAGSSTWQLVQPYGPSAVFNWNSTGAAAGTVNFSAWARAAASSAAYDGYTSIPYSVTASSCASVTASAAPAGVVQGSGTHVTITALASGCTTSPRYEFWMRPAGSSTWQLVQGYGTGATYDWNSTGAAAGTVYFSAWARDSGSTASYDAFASTPVAVTAASCASVTVSASPTSVAHGSGTHVTITGAATGCPSSPRYEFWMRPAGSSTWQLVQGYGASATYDWNSTGALAGTVYFSAWARDAGSAASYDAFASTPVTVS